MQSAKQHPVRFILLFFFVCFIFRAVEYLVIRTDQSVIGEAFLHKLAGIALLLAALRVSRYGWHDIGLRANGALRGICLGLLLGFTVFATAYGTEILMQISAENTPSLQFFVTSYTVQGNRGMQDGAIFILVCVIGNLINVVMEEGVFRGLFVKLLKEKYSFPFACILSSVLFGMWHIMQPVRNVLDGQQALAGAALAGLLLVVTSALLGVQYAMLFEITGSLWIGMTAHFVNNAIINLFFVRPPDLEAAY